MIAGQEDLTALRKSGISMLLKAKLILKILRVERKTESYFDTIVPEIL